MSLRIRFALFTVLLCGLALLAFMAGLGMVVFENMSEEAEFELKQLALSVDRSLPDAGEFDTEQLISISGESANMQLISVSDASGRTLFETNDRQDWPPWKTPREQNLSQFTLFGEFTTIWHQQNPWRLLHGHTASGNRIMAAAEIGEIAFEIRRMLWNALRAVPLALLVIGFTAWWITRKTTQPLVELTEAAEDISQGRLDRRITPTQRDDEIGRLVGTFNHMMDRLERSHRQATRFSADASHELQTPLTILQGRIEATIASEDFSQETLEDLGVEVARLKLIIEGLLLLSRCDSPGGKGLHLQTIDLATFAEEIAEDAHELANAAGAEFLSARDLPSDTCGKIDARLLRIAVMNLIDNALKYRDPPGSPIRFLATLDSAASMVIFAVENSGPEIDRNDREGIFDRFSRRSAETKIEGSGLGLSMTRAIAEAHRGSARLANSDSGSSRFEISVPIENRDQGVR